MSSQNSFEQFKTIADLKALSREELPSFSSGLRKFLIETISKTGGHLGANLGVVELTVALHYVFNSPLDRLIFDVGHQSYPHKILTGRKERLSTIRQKNGISGFTNIFESKHDVFGAGHSSTSISAGLGIMAGISEENFVIPIIGDGAMSAGLAFEGLNNASSVKGNLIIVLNDNDMSISPPTGAFSKYLSNIANSSQMLEMREFTKKVLPDGFLKILKTAERGLKAMTTDENFFESLDVSYHGIYDGHDVINLVEIFSHFKETRPQKPILLHIKTIKGFGYIPAENSHDKYHGVSPFDIATGKQAKKSFTSFSLTASAKLCEIARKEKDIFAITPAMEAGSELSNFATEFSDRFFDVGIAEQHAVTFSAGLATSGKKPYCFVYSTFLQRAYDSLIHDVLLQNLPVRFMVDRAGIVGEDGATHNGAFDIAFTRILPNISICSPCSKEELEKAVEFSANFEDGAFIIRFPRGEAKADFSPSASFEFGKGRILKQGKKTAILTFASTVHYGLNFEGITLVDLRFLKPLDESLILEIFNTHEKVILLEDGSIGGVYSSILELLHKNKVDAKNFIAKIIPDKFIEHGKIAEIHEEIFDFKNLDIV